MKTKKKLSKDIEANLQVYTTNYNKLYCVSNISTLSSDCFLVRQLQHLQNPRSNLIHVFLLGHLVELWVFISSVVLIPETGCGLFLFDNFNLTASIFLL